MPSKFDPQKYHRRSIRLKGYDYTCAGGYFITMVTYQRERLFGEIVEGKMQLNEIGKIVENAWFDLPNHYPNLELGTFCIMPNHVHAIIILVDPPQRAYRPDDTVYRKSSAPSNHFLPDASMNI